VRYGSIGGLEYEVPQSRLYCLCINVALCSTALQCILSCDTKKFHDNESTHILHNFWTSTHRAEASPFPLEAPLKCSMKKGCFQLLAERRQRRSSPGRWRKVVPCSHRKGAVGLKEVARFVAVGSKLVAAAMCSVQSSSVRIYQVGLCFASKGEACLHVSKHIRSFVTADTGAAKGVHKKIPGCAVELNTQNCA